MPTIVAQETLVVGQVKHSADHTPLPSVSVYFKNTKISTICNNEGYFSIRTTGKETTVVFSSIGFKTKELKLKPGSSVGVDVELDELSTELSEVFVIAGINDGWEWVKKIRKARKANDISTQKGFSQQGTEQNLVLLSKVTAQNTKKRIYEQLKKGNLTGSDTTLAVPLYMAENTWIKTIAGKKLLTQNRFNSDEMSEKIIEKLFGDLDPTINFYNNSITVLDKSIISPLANVGNDFYNYYLIDSIDAETGKQYILKFKAKNVKDLALNGKLLFDSATLSLTNVEAELSPKANINFIHNLSIKQAFKHLPGHLWIPTSEEITMKMNYQLLADSLHQKPELFVKRSANFQQTDSTLQQQSVDFAKSKYGIDSLNNKLFDINNTLLGRTARLVANVIFTGYIPVGIFDIGKVQTIARYTDIEGFRMNIPLTTNAKLWKNISVGGYLGYGFGNKELKYSGGVNYKLPFGKRNIVGLNYCNDYRLLNYDYNNFEYYENPLVTGDEDIASTIFGLRTGSRLNERHEFTASLTTDWSQDIESRLLFRSNTIYANNFLPMTIGSTSYTNIHQQSATLETRFSFDEKTYEDHLRRIYLQNYSPIFYGIFEYGKYAMGNVKGDYGKIIGAVKQKVRFDFGMFEYLIEGGLIIGNVPYPLLQSPHGNDNGGYSFHGFNTMRQMEFVTDNYIALHSELTLNGVILNHVPLIKYLNLRELITLHTMYGEMNNSHRALMDIPNFTKPLQNPYMEVGVGVSNLLQLFSLQSIWRLSQLHKPNIERWEVMLSFSVSF